MRDYSQALRARDSKKIYRKLIGEVVIVTGTAMLLIQLLITITI